MKRYSTVDAYIGSFPEDIRARLKKLRGAIKKAAPRAEEKISYGMPGYYLNGYLAYFGAWKSHIAFYPAGRIEGELMKLAAKYKKSTGTLQFPNGKPIPFGLVAKIVKLRVKQNLLKTKKKNERKK